MLFPVDLFSAVRGLSTYKEKLSSSDNLHLRCNNEFSSANRCFSVEVVKDEDLLVGHLAKEVSRIVYKWLDRGDKVEVKIYDSVGGFQNDVQRSFRAQGLEKGCLLTFKAEDNEHKNLLRRHFLSMNHKWNMSGRLIGHFSGLPH